MKYYQKFHLLSTVVNYQKEIMAEPIVSFAVERLGDLLISEAKFLYGVSDQVEEIRTELRRMQCFLKDADARQGGDSRVHNWVREIRQLAHETEDVLEIYALEVASKKDQRGSFKEMLRRFACIVREGKALHKLGSEIQTVKGKLSSITNSLKTYGINKALEEGESSNTKQQVSRISYSHLIERDFVGMEKDIEQVISHLKSEDNGCDVVSIWGMGGLGKTTLAAKIYNHTEVQTYFQAFAWVCITQQFQREKVLQTQQCQREKVLQSILTELLPERKEEISKMKDAELFRELHEVQKGKNCLVVIDDIWSLADWESLRPAFPIGEKIGSKILLTTRIRKVAEVGILHKLQHLNEEEGLELLLKKAFARKDDTPEERVKSEMEEIGRDMVRRCQGLPLAISTLGGILKGKVYREWAMINKGITSHLARGDGVEDKDEENRTVRGVLSLSYDNLPPRLRHSFLYLGNFKEDEIIFTGDLYLLWIAEGMVSLEDRVGEEMMLDVAERYLGELAQRSLVQVQPTSESLGHLPWSKFRACNVHDLVRDVCLSKGKEQNFLNVIDFERNHDYLLLNLNSTSADSDLTRRLCIRSFDDTTCRSSFVPFLQQQRATRKLRSLLFFQADKDGPHTDFPEEMSSLLLLRVLKLAQFDIDNVGHARRIGELVYLKYLSFKGCSIREIPSSIGNLRNLETLDLRIRSTDIIIPNVLWKLKQLQHLYLPYERFKVNEVEKLRFDGLSELELLCNFRPLVCDANDILKLRKLQVFRGYIEGSLEDLPGIISSITSSSRRLRYSSLYIKNYGDHFDSELEEGVVSPWILLLECPFLNELWIAARIGLLPTGEYRFSQSLTFMNLVGCELEEDPMIILEKIPNLRFLKLWGNCYMGKEIVCSAFGFPQLRHLEFYFMKNLVEWRVDEGAMPNLSELRITACDKLKMLPDGLRLLSALQKLYILGMPSTFENRVQVRNGVTGEDFHKVCRIPTIKFKTL